MTPDVLARLAPHMSVFHPGDPATAAGPLMLRVLQALDAGDIEALMESAEGDSVYVQVSVHVRQAARSAAGRWLGPARGTAGTLPGLRWDAP